MTTSRAPDQPEPSGKTEQQIFDEQIARASGKTVVMFGGLGILAALVMSDDRAGDQREQTTTTVTVAAAPAAGQRRRRRSRPRSRATRWAHSSSSRGSPTPARSAAGRATR